jgi:hypothetical protein
MKPELTLSRTAWVFRILEEALLHNPLTGWGYNYCGPDGPDGKRIGVYREPSGWA